MGVAACRDKKFQQRNLVATHELVYRNVESIALMRGQFFGQ
jgi:hypothetical protein